MTWIFGGAGEDTIRGGRGNDLYRGQRRRRHHHLQCRRRHRTSCSAAAAATSRKSTAPTIPRPSTSTASPPRLHQFCRHQYRATASASAVPADDINFEVATRGVEDIFIDTGAGPDVVVITGSLGGTGLPPRPSPSTAASATTRRVDAGGLTSDHGIIFNADDGDDYFYLQRRSFGNDEFDGGDGIDTIDFSHFILRLRRRGRNRSRAHRSAGHQLRRRHVDRCRERGRQRIRRHHHRQRRPPMTLTAAPATTPSTAGDGDDEIYGGDGGDIIRGGRGDDYIEGNGGADDIRGGRGDDVIFGGGGGDTIRGGGGDDHDRRQRRRRHHHLQCRRRPGRGPRRRRQ